jgi:hypothetical protein
MDMERVKMATDPKPLIQIDDEIREMTDQEYAVYLQEIANVPPLNNS